MTKTPPSCGSLLARSHSTAECYSILVDEKIDVLDARGLMTGEVTWKSEAHRLGLWHRCFHCWIVSPETSTGGPYLFVQRRATGKETWPDRLDVTVGGHLGAGEEALNGIREVEEELGSRLRPEISSRWGLAGPSWRYRLVSTASFRRSSCS